MSIKRPYGDGNLQRIGSPLNNRMIYIKEPDVLVEKIDEPSAVLTYIGRAQTGSNVAGPVWQICRLSVSGTVTTKEWADGDGKFDNIWNNRASLTYL